MSSPGLSGGGGARTLPHNSEAEASVLGGILLHGRHALTEVGEHITDEDFYVPAHQAIYRAMLTLDGRGDPIDPITLESVLRSRDEIKLVGGIEALTRLADRYATSHNLVTHAKMVRQKARLRTLVITARGISNDGCEEVEDINSFIDLSEQKILEVSERGRKTGYRASKDVILDVFRSITKRREQESSITGVATHFAQLDEMTAGLQPGDLVIIAARPSMGKTAFALNIAQAAAIVQPRHVNLPEEERPPLAPVLFFSLEMGAEQLIERILCAEARVDAQDLRRGRFNNEHDFRKLIAAADRIASSKVHIDDAASPSILEIRNSARRWRNDRSIFPPTPDGEEQPLGLVMVDYLQLCRGGMGRYDSREREISEISRGLKGLAKELKVPVIALSQLNRAVDSRADHRPMMSDLRESGAIEQDADVIMFIYREERYLTADATEEERARLENKAEVIIGKQRNGPIGTVHLNFIKRFTRFEDPAPDDFQR